MEFINPTITIQNTDAGKWLATLDMPDMGNHQHMTLCFLIPKTPGATLQQVQDDILKTAQKTIAAMLGTQGT